MTLVNSGFNRWLPLNSWSEVDFVEPRLKSEALQASVKGANRRLVFGGVTKKYAKGVVRPVLTGIFGVVFLHGGGNRVPRHSARRSGRLACKPIEGHVKTPFLPVAYHCRYRALHVITGIVRIVAVDAYPRSH
jgi:hypothetical protein